MAKKRKGRYGRIYGSLLVSKKLERLFDVDKPRDLHAAKAALGVWALGIAHGNLQLTDGEVTAYALANHLHGTTDDAALLVAAGFWTVEATGWQYVDWEESNNTRAEVFALQRSGEVSACNRDMKKGQPCRCGDHEGNPEGNHPANHHGTPEGNHDGYPDTEQEQEQEKHSKTSSASAISIPPQPAIDGVGVGIAS